MTRCWVDTGDDKALDQAVADRRLDPGDAEAVREFRAVLAELRPQPDGR